MDRKTALLLIAALGLIVCKCLFPPSDALRRQAADLLGYREAWIQALAGCAEDEPKKLQSAVRPG